MAADEQGKPRELAVTIALDTSALQEAIGDLLEPGAVLLSRSAVKKLWDEHGVHAADLVRVGGIISSDEG